MSISWIEAPYDWAMYAQFPPDLPRMPSWWPLNMTWGGLPAPVPVGYMSYFALPAVIAAAIGRQLHERKGWARPVTLLTTGLVVGFCWAFVFNAILGAQLGVFHYGKVIGGLALWEGTAHQYPIYDSVAMGIQMMVFTYLLGRTDAQGRTLIEAWADKRTSSRPRSIVLSLAAVVVIALVVRTRRPFYRSRPGRWLWGSTLVVLCTALILPYLPGVALFGFVPLPAPLMLGMIGLTLAYVAVVEVAKQRFYAHAEAAGA